MRDVLDPSFLRGQLDLLQEREAPLSSEEYSAAVDELDRAERRVTEIEAAPKMIEGARPRPDAAFYPRTLALNLLQSTIETCIESRWRESVKEADDGAGVAPGRLPEAELDPEVDLYRPFGPCDIGWIASKIAEGTAHFRDRPDFPDDPGPTTQIADDARVVMVSDWATGVEGARLVAERIGAELAGAEGRDRHLIHLGDTYYSGWREEYLKRFLPYWPHALGDAGVKSWALNGNHDMYSGGHGYFGTLLRDPRFEAHGGSSFFKLEGSHWQLLGLDTAYVDHDLAGSQADWVRDELAASAKKTVLLSHHQPFSAYAAGDAGTRLRDRLAPAFSNRRADAWFWGHEHRCAIYEESESIRYPRCIGHGGVPVIVPPENAPRPEGVLYEYRGAQEASSYRWGLFGFVVLDFRSDAIDVRYINERGEEHHREELH